MNPPSLVIDELDVVTAGRLFRTARLRNEWHDFPQEPETFIRKLRAADSGADVFTFLDEIPHLNPRFPYARDVESISVMPITTYDEWWKKQIPDKTRNMIRKAGKKGLDIRLTDFDDKFLHGLKEIYDESPIRQGMRFWHYQKDLEELRRIHVTFLERTQFIAAYLNDELVGFIKLTYNNGSASFMQIISKISHRDKAPNNAMIAKAVEICVEKKVPYILYGIWSRRGLGEFKINHGFERFDMPRYFVPLTAWGKLMIKLKLYRKATDYLPEPWVNTLATWRGRYLAYRYRNA